MKFYESLREGGVDEKLRDGRKMGKQGQEMERWRDP